MKNVSYKWRLLAFLFVTFFLEQAARQVFGATLPQIKLDFATLGVTDAQLGLVSSVFTFVFDLAAIVLGEKPNDQDYDRDLRTHEITLRGCGILK